MKAIAKFIAVLYLSLIFFIVFNSVIVTSIICYLGLLLVGVSIILDSENPVRIKQNYSKKRKKFITLGCFVFLIFITMSLAWSEYDLLSEWVSTNPKESLNLLFIIISGLIVLKGSLLVFQSIEEKSMA